MPAGMRGAYHTTALAGADMSMSISPGIQKMLGEEKQPWAEHILEEVDEEIVGRLMTLSEFRRAYEPDGMRPEDFITFGATQKTLSQFVEAGWGSPSRSTRFRRNNDGKKTTLSGSATTRRPSGGTTPPSRTKSRRGF
jgi:hypothetical protein